MKAIALAVAALSLSGCAALNIRIVRAPSEAELRARAAAEEVRVSAIRSKIAGLIESPMPRTEFEQRLRVHGARFSRDDRDDVFRAAVTLHKSESGGSYYHLESFISYQVDSGGMVVSARCEEGATIGCPAAPRPALRDWKIQR